MKSLHETTAKTGNKVKTGTPFKDIHFMGLSQFTQQCLWKDAPSGQQILLFSRDS